MKPLTAASDAPDADRRPLKLVAALGIAAVALLTVFNYYGFAASTAATEQAASPKALLEHQARAEALLEEIREVLRSQELLQVVNTTSTIDAWSATEQQLRQEQPADDNASKSSSEAAMRFPGDHDDSQMHIVFSMSCGQRNRLMQQSVLQLTAAWVGQKGPITAIMSGCSEADQAELLKEPTFYYDFRLHFTPGYAVNPEPGYEDSYLAYNKPFGLRHFLQNAQPPVKHEIITLLDGDFYFFRPLEVNTGRNVSRYYGGSRDPAIINDTVVDGWALAQDWTNVNRGGFYEGENANGTLDKVCHGLPCGNVSVADGLEYYANIGPPYIMTLNDAKRFVDDYCHLCVVSRSVMPVWMTEMFAFSVAAANNNIKYTGLTNLGISSPGYQWGNHEYWTFVDGSMANPCEDNLAFVMPQDPPYAVHTCQYIGNFYKGKFPDTIANCDSPLFKLLPTTEWSAIETDVEEYLRPLRRQEVWAKCTLIKITNRALTELKQRTCPDGFNTFRGIDAIDKKRRAQSTDMSPWTPRGPQH